MPCYNDFSEILGLMDVKKLYEEQEEKWGMRVRERDEQLQNVRQDLDWRRQQIATATGGAPIDQELARLETEKATLIQEAQQKIAALNTRLDDLNKRLTGK